MIIKEITFKIQASNPFEAKAKNDYLQNLANLDNDVLEKLTEVMKSKNAINQFVKNFEFIKNFLK